MIRTLAKARVRGRSVLLRVDFNVELKNGEVSEKFRIERSLKTIRWLLKRDARVLILSHLGRPVRRDGEFSLRPAARYLSKLLGQKVIFFEQFSQDFAKFWRILPTGTVGMLENLRFWPAEERNDAAFARILAAAGDLYVNDAFAVSHRKNASIAAITRYLPSYAGFLLSEELVMLDKVRRAQKHPFVAIFGGKKLSDKLPLIGSFQKRADAILVGGGVANTFLAAAGNKIGKSFAEMSLKKEATAFLKSGRILLPKDWKVGHEAILDIGPKTEREYAKVIDRARLILWNGPMGYIENPRFRHGSEAVTRAIARNRRAFSIVGGGETVGVIEKLGLRRKISFVSTGGGAMLEYLAGKKLPGIEALKRHS